MVDIDTTLECNGEISDLAIQALARMLLSIGDIDATEENNISTNGLLTKRCFGSRMDELPRGLSHPDDSDQNST